VDELGLGVQLEINSLGSPRSVARTGALIAHFEAHRDGLDEEARRRLYSNPLRILDTKNPRCSRSPRARRGCRVPREASLAHFERLQSLLPRRTSRSGSTRASCADSTTTT